MNQSDLLKLGEEKIKFFTTLLQMPVDSSWPDRKVMSIELNVFLNRNRCSEEEI